METTSGGVGEPPTIYPRTRITVLDTGTAAAPRTLWGLEGERVIIPVHYLPASDASWYSTDWWAALTTDDGLVFVGQEAEYFGINLEFPTLCGPSAEAARDSDQELAFLIHWTEELNRLGPDDDPDLALQRACEEA